MILDGKKYNVKNKTSCDCGYEFTLKDMENLTKINQPGFYGNVVKHYSHSKCKQCGRDVVLLLKQVGQTYQIIDIAIPKHNDTKAENNNTNVIKVNIATDKSETKSEEYICPICKKVCKSQIGLNSHIKTHQN